MLWPKTLELKWKTVELGDHYIISNIDVTQKLKLHEIKSSHLFRCLNWETGLCIIKVNRCHITHYCKTYFTRLEENSNNVKEKRKKSSCLTTYLVIIYGMKDLVPWSTKVKFYTDYNYIILCWNVYNDIVMF